MTEKSASEESLIWECPKYRAPGRKILYGDVDFGRLETMRQQSPTGLIELGGWVQHILVSEEGGIQSSPDYRCDLCGHTWCLAAEAVD